MEIGGFVKFTKPNPPPGKYLDSLVRTYGEMYRYWAESLPRLAVREAAATPESRRFTVRAVVENTGRLPTNVTQKAVANGRAGPVVVRLTTSPGVELVEGERQDTLGTFPGPDWVTRRGQRRRPARARYAGRSERRRARATGWRSRRRPPRPARRAFA